MKSKACLLFFFIMGCNHVTAPPFKCACSDQSNAWLHSHSWHAELGGSTSSSSFYLVVVLVHIHTYINIDNLINLSAMYILFEWMPLHSIPTTEYNRVLTDLLFFFFVCNIVCMHVYLYEQSGLRSKIQCSHL